MFQIVALIALRLIAVEPMSVLESVPARTEGLSVGKAERTVAKVPSMSPEALHETFAVGATKAEAGSCQKCTVIEESSGNPGSWILSWGAKCTIDKTDCADCRGGSLCDDSQSSLWDGPCDMECCGSGGTESMAAGGCGEQLAVNPESATAVRAALKKHSASVVLNSGRRALQVVSCSGQVLQSVPLADEVFRAVVSSTD